MSQKSNRSQKDVFNNGGNTGNNKTKTFESTEVHEFSQTDPSSQARPYFVGQPPPPSGAPSTPAQPDYLKLIFDLQNQIAVQREEQRKEIKELSSQFKKLLRPEGLRTASTGSPFVQGFEEFDEEELGDMDIESREDPKEHKYTFESNRDFLNLPPQQVHLHDIPDMKTNDDLHLYLQKFDMSFNGISQVTDKQKIFRLINKLHNVEIIFQAASEMQHFNSYPRFKGQLVRMFGKTKSQIYSDFENLTQNPGEKVSQFMDRCYMKLNLPFLKLNKGVIISDLYHKLPPYYKDNIEKVDIKNYEQMKLLIQSIEKNKVHTNMERVLYQQGKLPVTQKQPTDSPNKYESRTQQNSYQQNRYSPNSQQKYSPRKYTNTSHGNSENKEKPQKQASFYLGVIPSEQPVLQDGTEKAEQPQPFSFPTCLTYNQQQKLPILAHHMETRSKARENQQSQQPYNNVQQSSSNQQTEQSLHFDTNMDSENSTSQQPQSPQRSYQYMPATKQNVQDIQRQVWEATQKQDANILLDSGIFTDQDGNLQVTRALKSIKYPLSLYELTCILDNQRQGKLSCYYSAQGQKVQQNLLVIAQQTTKEQQRQQEVFRVKNLGQHLTLTLQVLNTPLTAIVDTGAVQTLISTQVVEYCNLQQHCVAYNSSPEVQGVSGSLSISQVLKNVTCILAGFTFTTDIPVVQTNAFQVLLGQDVLQHKLQNCTIQVSKKVLQFEHSKRRFTAPLYTVQNETSSFQNTKTVQNKASELWPKFEKLPAPFDLALIDPPLSYTPYFNQMPSFDTNTVPELESFKNVLDTQMKSDSAILIWSSCKRLPDILYLLQVWGYEYVNTALVWVKLNKDGEPKLGLGFWSRNNVELLLLAKKGQISFCKTQQKNISQAFFTLLDKPETSQHSSKPACVYDLIAQIFDMNKIDCVEYFARYKDNAVQRDRFCLFGNEIQDSIYVPPCKQALQTFFCSYSSTQPLTVNNEFQDFLAAIDMDDSYRQNFNVQAVLKRHFQVFDYQGQVGCAKNQQLELNFKTTPQPPTLKVPKYSKEKLDFLSETVKEFEKKGFIKDGNTNFIYAPVIVVKKNSSKKFRVCYNFQPLNEQLQDETFIQQDAEQILRHGGKAAVLCSLDCAAAHQQIPVKEDQTKYLGLWTPSGTKISLRGQFGIINIAKTFSRGIDKSIGHLKPKVWVYADDIIVYAETLEEALNLLDEVLTCLSRDGYVISYKKCKLFKTELEVLGQTVGNGQVSISESKVSALRNMKVPVTKKELQSFIGVVTYLRKFVPNLATLLQPLYQVLKGEQAFYLDPLQTSVIQELKQLITSNNVLSLPQLDKPFYITVSYNSLGYGACLLQKNDNVLKPIAYRSKTMSVAEYRKPQFLLKLKALRQAVKEWRDIILYSKIIVLTDNSILSQAFKFNGENSQINKLQAELQEYHIEIQVKPDTFKPLKFCQLLKGTSESENIDVLESLLTEYERTEKQLIVPVKKNLNYKFNFGNFDVSAFFDGASSRKLKPECLGTYGWVILDNSGTLLHEEQGQVFSQDIPTNNISECFALKKLLLFLLENKFGNLNVRIYGDSELVINQIKHLYRVNNNAIRVFQREISTLLKQFKRVSLVHIPRELNEQANFRAQETMKLLLKSKIESQKQQIQAFVVQAPDTLSQIHCVICGRRGQEQYMMLCDNCGCGHHTRCLGEPIEALNYFFCKDCDMQLFDIHCTKDLTQDLQFIEFLQNDTISLSKQQREQYTNLAKFYAFQNGDLYFRSKQELKKVPSISERFQLIMQVHQQLAHCSIFNTLRILKQQYFWPNMHNDVRVYVQKCALCQARKSAYQPMSSVYPTFKGLGIWQCVSADLIEIRSEQQEIDQGRYILSVICNFSKCPELIPLKNKTSENVALAFRDQVVFRYGCPLIVRTDCGSEFEGHFSQLMQRFGIFHAKSSPRYPQGNGAVEKLNQLVKHKLQVLYNSEEYTDTWFNLVQTIAFSIKVSVSRSTGFSPFQIMYGRDCLLPGKFPLLQEDCYTEPTFAYLSQYLADSIKTNFNTESKVRQNLKHMDSEIIKTMNQREFKCITNLQFSQPIFVKATEPTKLNLGIEGVCYFVEYIDIQRRDTIIYYNPRTRRFLQANISNVKICNI